MEKISVGILGATGMVGQHYLCLLENHPWFEVAYVAASPRSAGTGYEDAVQGRWHMDRPIPETVRSLILEDANEVSRARGRCGLVFSALAGQKERIAALELEYADAGVALVSNASAHRMTPDVPMVIPEVNPHHTDIIPIQRKNRGWGKGLIAVKSNCSIQSYMTPVHALIQAGFPVKTMVVTTLQALSGAGHPGPSALDLTDNIIPYIPGEEEKSEQEPLKLLGQIEGNHIISLKGLNISAHCTRVAVTHGHTACVSLEFSDQVPEPEKIRDIWENFSALPQTLNLPSAPARPLVYLNDPDRPQPRKDRDLGNGMAISLGRLRPCNALHIRFTGLHHNTIRGAAGGAVLTAELLRQKGYIH